MDVIIDVENLKTRLQDIVRLDKTPLYQYQREGLKGCRAPDGELPGIGSCFMTPAEIAREMLSDIEDQGKI